MTTTPSRRTALKAAAWAAPVVALAVTAPLASASEPHEPPTICGGTPWDNGTYLVQGDVLTILYKQAPDIYEVNARGVGWSKSYGTNYGTAPVRGSLTWVITLPGKPLWVQVHSFNAHLGGEC